MNFYSDRSNAKKTVAKRTFNTTLYFEICTCRPRTTYVRNFGNRLEREGALLGRCRRRICRATLLQGQLQPAGEACVLPPARGFGRTAVVAVGLAVGICRGDAPGSLPRPEREQLVPPVGWGPRLPSAIYAYLRTEPVRRTSLLCSIFFISMFYSCNSLNSQL